MKGHRCSCNDCNCPVSYVRCTQFAGDHFYCAEHAKREKDFGKPDKTGWHHDWCAIKDYRGP